jgi:hypothetical protein
MMIASWQKTGSINPKSLTEARLQLHHAIQFPAAVGNCLIEPQPDTSHASLTWHPQLNLLVSGFVTTEKPFQVALEPVSLTLIILNLQGEKLAEFSLEQKTMEQGMNWLKIAIEPWGAKVEKLTFIPYPEDFSVRPLALGTPFEKHLSAQRQELTAYYANTNLLLQEIVATTEGASAIRIWPHHFDLATLISLPYIQKGEATSIGVGMSPGDSNYDEPYWYVSPWPYPNLANFPELNGGGNWHTEGWLGAILTASNLSQENKQSGQIQTFFNSAVDALLTLLGENQD